jgi:manganese/iron transport system permease protein
VKEDTAIGVLFAGTFALGVVLISTSRNFTRNLVSFLFGNVLGVTSGDILASAVVGAVVLALIGLFYRELQITAFDRIGARDGPARRLARSPPARAGRGHHRGVAQRRR